ncbi:MAG: GAF domain-containing protein, partial [Myxococcaceae bacterium]
MSTRGQDGRSSETREDALIRRSQSEAREEARDVAREESGCRTESDPRSLDYTRRLRRLYDISTLLTRFESAERTVPQVIALVAQALPIRSAIFLLMEDKGGPRTIRWQAEGESADRMRVAEAHARSVHRYLIRSGGDRDGEEEKAKEASAPRLAEKFIVLPLVIAQQPTFGVLQFEGAIPFDEVDLIFVNSVVNQLAIALDRQAVINAKQAIAEAGEREQRLLADVSAVVGSSLDYRSTLTALARSAVPQFADLCLIDEIGEDGIVQRREVKFADDTKQRELAGRFRRLSLQSHARVLASHHSMLFGRSTDLVAGGLAQEEADALRDAGIESMMAVPLLARGQRLGVLTFATTASGRRYSTHELGLAEELARRAAIAIDNARLFEQAQRATLARENLLAVVSHDLKSPLGVILMNLGILLKKQEGDDRTGARKQLTAIQS